MFCSIGLSLVAFSPSNNCTLLLPPFPQEGGLVSQLSWGHGGHQEQLELIIAENSLVINKRLPFQLAHLGVAGVCVSLKHQFFEQTASSINGSPPNTASVLVHFRASILCWSCYVWSNILLSAHVDKLNALLSFNGKQVYHFKRKGCFDAKQMQRLNLQQLSLSGGGSLITSHPCQLSNTHGA